MARQRITLVSDEVKQKQTIEQKIVSGEINSTNFSALPLDEQAQVNKVLFDMASRKVDPNQGASALEFILFGFMRIMNKQVNGLSLTVEDQEVKAALDRIMALHQITDQAVFKANWLFDYMGYAELKAGEFLQNRKDHINRKIQVTGQK